MKDVNKAELAQIQKTHLDLLESAFNKIEYSGVPIIRCMTYKIIQIVNNVGLKAYLEGLGDGQDTDQQ